MCTTPARSLRAKAAQAVDAFGRLWKNSGKAGTQNDRGRGVELHLKEREHQEGLPRRWAGPTTARELEGVGAL